MRRFLRISAVVLAAPLVLLAVLAVAARWADGPLGMFPGGPFRSGEWVDRADVDWSFAQGASDIELQSDGRSRTVWFFVHAGELYVPASVNFPPFKRWHLRALEDPRAVVRIQGRRYRRTLHRIQDPSVLEAIRARARTKYGVSADPASVWLFRLDPATPAADPSATRLPAPLESLSAQAAENLHSHSDPDRASR